jgi:hypothetical protein
MIMSFRAPVEVAAEEETAVNNGPGACNRLLRRVRCSKQTLPATSCCLHSGEYGPSFCMPWALTATMSATPQDLLMVRPLIRQVLSALV